MGCFRGSVNVKGSTFRVEAVLALKASGLWGFGA